MEYYIHELLLCIIVNKIFVLAAYFKNEMDGSNTACVIFILALKFFFLIVLSNGHSRPVVLITYGRQQQIIALERI